MSKSSNGEGGVRKRSDGRWEARYTRPVDGVWKRYSIFAKTRVEAAQQLRAELAKRDAGGQPLPARETVETFLEAWLKGAEPTLRPQTVVKYRQSITNYLLPTLGRIPLARLQPQQVAQLYQQLLDSGLSAKTVRNAHGVLHRALEQAVRWRQLPVNVAHLVDPPRRAPREMQAFTAEEARQVLAAAAGDDLEALWTLALTAGIRQGELLALRWPDVDLERGSLRVVANMIRLAGQEPQLGEPKSRRSRRQIELSAGAVEALRRHRQAQKVASLWATSSPARMAGHSR